MYFTNPSERDFSKFIGTYVFEEMEKKQEIQEIGRFSSGLAAMYVEKNVIRSNFIFASYFHLDFYRLRSFGAKIEDVNMIGIFGTFFPLPNL
jgi:hypothetical protein